MWFQFSLTVVLAVGLAVKHGPGALLADPLNDEHAAFRPRRSTERIDDHQVQERIASQRDEYGTLSPGAVIADKDQLPLRFLDNIDGADSGYGSIAFAETLGPADFEAG